MLDLINGSARFMSDLFQTHPDQHGTANVVSDDPRPTALATFNASQLLVLAVKLLLDLRRHPKRVLDTGQGLAHCRYVAGPESVFRHFA